MLLVAPLIADISHSERLMVYNTANRHVAAVSALLDALFPALDQEATAAREAGNEAQAIFLETSGAKDPAVALLVRDCCALVGCSCRGPLSTHSMVSSENFFCRCSKQLVSCHQKRNAASHCESSPSAHHSNHSSARLFEHQAMIGWCCRILELLQWRMGTLLLGGTAALSSSPPFLQPFTQLSLSARTSILQAWATSSIPKLLEVGGLHSVSVMAGGCPYTC